ncbi:MAG: mechanosensitive ion channel family protein [Bacilli bacterium]|nr:mechanosensitive ion channel family protein [Bacilli bacterium]
MKLFHDFCEYLSSITTIDKGVISVVLLTTFIVAFFSLVKMIGKRLIRRKLTGRGEYVLNQSFRVMVNIFEILALLLVWGEYIKNLMTLISVLSAAMTIALREIILNFFCGIYIKFKRPFKVEDRIQIKDIKGDVMNISTLSFEVLEVSTKEDNGQSTGVVVNFPNSIVFSEPIKNINKGFKYIWNEIVVRISFDGDLIKNKQEIYKIVNGIETIKSIPRKMKSEINEANTENRVYFNKYDPIIYTKIANTHVELTVRYLMHPKKSLYVESVIWNKIYNAYKEGKIDLYLSDI